MRYFFNKISIIAIAAFFLMFLMSCGSDSGSNVKLDELKNSDDVNFADSLQAYSSSSSKSDVESDKKLNDELSEKSGSELNGGFPIGKNSSSSMAEQNNKENVSSSSEVNEQGVGTIKDPRDGIVYKTVRIGNQVWFAENLNYDDGFAGCPMHDAKNCEKYGRLYQISNTTTGSSATDICPDGWHVPDSDDWEELIKYVDKNNGKDLVGVSLKAKSGWVSGGETLENSSRVGATKGTDSFGFSAIPAGSCWPTGDCYVNDDARFYVDGGNVENSGAYLFAFDSDDIVFDYDSHFASVSVRCVQNSFKIDAMPSLKKFGSIIWMMENLSHNGSQNFTMREAKIACPNGWRLPTYGEFEKEYKNLNIAEENESFVFAWGDDRFNVHNVSCGIYSCQIDDVASNGHVRCVYEKDVDVEPVSDCVCSVSEFNTSDNTASWSISGCKENGNKISGYTWNFGDNSVGVKTNGAKAQKTFTVSERIAPTVNVRASVNVGGFDVDNSELTVQCPSILALVSSQIVFEYNKGVKLFYGSKYTASLKNNDCKGASLQCGYGIDVKINDEIVNSSTIGDIVCDKESFSIEVSGDTECNISYW